MSCFLKTRTKDINKFLPNYSTLLWTLNNVQIVVYWPFKANIILIIKENMFAN